MDHSNNPAGRLYLLLTEGKKKSDDTKSREIWAELLDVEPNDTSLLLRRLAKVIDLPAQIREQINKEQEINHDTFLKGMPNIEDALSRIDITKAWKAFKERVNDVSINSLEFCGEHLSRKNPDIPAKYDDLKKIHDDVRQLFDEVFEGDLDEELR